MWLLSSSSTARVGEWPTSSRICLTYWDHQQLGWCLVYAGPSSINAEIHHSAFTNMVNHIAPPKKFKLQEGQSQFPHLF